MTLNTTVLVLFLATMLATCSAFAGLPEPPRRIEIVASRFSYTPNEISLKKGEPVVLVFRSTDVTHGLKLEEMNIKSEIKKGKDTEIMLTPAEVGHFVGKCAHFCGKGHGSMTLQVDVVE
jgi:cytochrome c oxidase subunit II